jgi:hypothetical protein
MQLDYFDLQLKFVKDVYESKRGKVTEGDDLPPGVIKMAKVYVAVKRKLNPSATRWPDVTATRALSPTSCLKRTCRSLPTGHPWTWF